MVRRRFSSKWFVLLTKVVAAKYDQGMRELPDDYSRRVRDQLYHARPDHAQFYALASVGEGSSSGRRYPMNGSYLLCPENQFQLPYGAPSGEYRVLFYRQQFDNAMLPYRKTHPSFRLVLQWPTQGPTSAAQPESGAISPAVRTVERDPELREAEIEFEKHKMAVAMQRDTHQLVRSAAHARDVGESYSVVSAYRQDSYLSAEAYGALNRRMVENLSKIQETHVGLVQSIEPTILAIKRASELLAVPARPVDYTPVLLECVKLGGELVNRLVENTSQHRSATDEPRGLGEPRASKQAQTEFTASSKPDNSQPNPSSILADKQRPPTEGRQSATSLRSDDSRSGGPENQGLVAEETKPTKQPQPMGLSDQEALINDLARPAITATTAQPNGGGSATAESTQAIPLAQPAARKQAIDLLTDPQRPELAAATHAFLNLFESEEELRVVVAAFNPAILGTQSSQGKR